MTAKDYLNKGIWVVKMDSMLPMRAKITQTMTVTMFKDYVRKNLGSEYASLKDADIFLGDNYEPDQIVFEIALENSNSENNPMMIRPRYFGELIYLTFTETISYQCIPLYAIDLSFLPSFKDMTTLFDHLSHVDVKVLEDGYREIVVKGAKQA
jgi:hypothetical protein